MPAVAAFPVLSTEKYQIQHLSHGATIADPGEDVWSVVHLNSDRDNAGSLVSPASLPETTMEGVGTTRYANYALGVPARDGMYYEIMLNGGLPARVTGPISVLGESENEAEEEYTQLDLIYAGRVVTLTSRDGRWHIGNFLA